MGWQSGSFFKKNMKQFRILVVLVALVCCSINAKGIGNRSYENLISALSNNKTYYVISEEVDLSGKTIEFPKNAIIDFRGGVIRNGTIICNDNTLVGFSGLSENVSVKGTVRGPLNVSVFMLRDQDRSFDLGRVLNKAGKICNSIIIPEGEYYYQTPIILENIKYYQQTGDLIYNGKAKDVTTFKFYNAFTAVINIMGKIAYDSDLSIINYTKTNRTNIVGVEFANINNSRIYIGDVEYFNNNIRISAYGSGNCYNQYEFNLSVFSNEHVRIYQADRPSGQIGWCNENIFIGGRFCNWSHFDWKRCESVAIKIEGAGKNDTYNSVNSLLFIKPCMEGYAGAAVYAKNVTGCHWQDARTEDSSVFVKFVGNCHYNEVNTLYGNEEIDYRECTTYPLIVRDIIPVFSTMDSNSRVIDVNTKDAKLFKVVFNNADAKARVGVQYLTEASGKSIVHNKQKNMVRPRSTSHPSSYYYNTNSNQWMLGADASESSFVVPNEVTKIRITLSGKFSGAVVYSNKQTEVKEL